MTISRLVVVVVFVVFVAGLTFKKVGRCLDFAISAAIFERIISRLVVDVVVVVIVIAIIIVVIVVVKTLVGVLTLDFPIAATIFDRTTVMQRTEIRVEVTLLHKPTHERHGQAKKIQK